MTDEERSDVNLAEEQGTTKEQAEFLPEDVEKLFATHERIAFIFKYAILGFATMLIFRFLGLIFGGFIWLFLAQIGLVILCWPMYQRIRQYGFWDALRVDDYEVITTYTDGSRSSDGGFESTIFNLFLRFAVLAIQFLAAMYGTLFYMIYLFIKYSIQYLRCSIRPPFQISAFPQMLLCIGLLFGIAFIGFFEGFINKLKANKV
jgi:hypothetical protein